MSASHECLSALGQLTLWVRLKVRGGCTHPHVRQMKEPQFIPQTFTLEQVRLLVEWKPGQGFYGRQLAWMVLILLDSGARISEVLGLRVY